MVMKRLAIVCHVAMPSETHTTPFNPTQKQTERLLMKETLATSEHVYNLMIAKTDIVWQYHSHTQPGKRH